MKGRITLTPKRLFLIDSAGGLLSAFLLGVILARFETIFGMPPKILYFLAVIACVYACYSFLSYWLVEEKWRAFMKGIALANLLYCCLTIGLVIFYHSALTKLGVIYFLLEVGVILGLVIMELKTAFGWMEE